jgi:hypothetical protein
MNDSKQCRSVKSIWKPHATDFAKKGEVKWEMI